MQVKLYKNKVEILKVILSQVIYNLAIISAISKNLDKSTDLKKQIDAAILKGEIKKDIEQR